MGGFIKSAGEPQKEPILRAEKGSALKGYRTNLRPSLPTILPLAARPTPRRGLPQRDFIPDSLSMSPDFLGYRKHLGAESVGVLDLDPLPVTQDDESVRWPLPIPLFDE